MLRVLLYPGEALVHIKRLFMVFSATACLPGCAVMYDARRDANATAVATAFEKAAPGTYFDDLQTAYASVGLRERDAALRQVQVGRKAELLDVIAPTIPSPAERALMTDVGMPRGTAMLRRLVKVRTEALTGCPSAGGCQIADASTLIQRRGFALQYPQFAKTAADAADVLKVAADGMGALPADQTVAIPAICPGPRTPFPTISAEASALMAARILAGIANACRDEPLAAFKGTSGELGRLSKALEQDRTAQISGEQAAREVKAEIAALDVRVKSLDRSDALAAAAKVRDRLADLKLPDLAKLAGAEKLGNLIDDILKVELGSSAAEAAPKNSVSTPATAAATETPGKTTKRAQAVLDLVGAADALVNAYAKMPAGDRVSALLVAKAAQQQRLDVATLDVRRAADLLAIHQQQLEARLTELSFLSSAELALRATVHDSDRGYGELAKGDAGWFSQASVAYGLASSRGELIAVRLNRRGFEIERSYQVDLAARTTANRRALIAPLVQQIQAAGKVGLKPELVATLLGQVGVGAAVLGK